MADALMTPDNQLMTVKNADGSESLVSVNKRNPSQVRVLTNSLGGGATRVQPAQFGEALKTFDNVQTEEQYNSLRQELVSRGLPEASIPSFQTIQDRRNRARGEDFSKASDAWQKAATEHSTMVGAIDNMQRLYQLYEHWDPIGGVWSSMAAGVAKTLGLSGTPAEIQARTNQMIGANIRTILGTAANMSNADREFLENAFPKFSSGREVSQSLIADALEILRRNEPLLREHTSNLKSVKDLNRPQTTTAPAQGGRIQHWTKQ
jgi:hypothetical protein